jgi:3-phosphoshikimate 1-carboxyvinyltransferase
MANSEDATVVKPARGIRGTIRVPGDKSISHRAAMLSALATGESAIEGFLASEDCVNTLKALAALGAGVERRGTSVRVRGTGGIFRAPAQNLDMGNSGTGMRLLAGLLAGQNFSCTLTGDASLCARPMRRIKEPLERMGARLELLGKNNCAPIRLTGARLRGIEYALPVASAQVKSCVLLAGLFADGVTAVVEPMPTRDHTEVMFRALGIPLTCAGNRLSVQGSAGTALRMAARDWTVPGDFSSAAFWLTAAACREGGQVVVRGVGLNPRRTALLDVLRRMGADIGAQEDGPAAPTVWEPCGTVTVRGRGLRGTVVAGSEIPNLIDELPCVAVAGALANGETVIRDAAELRVKESDRIAAMATALRAFGVKVAEKPDGMIVTGPTKLTGGTEIDSYGDHRIAMAAAILTLFADAPVRVKQTACIATSYPGFWNDLAAATGEHGQ